MTARKAILKTGVFILIFAMVLTGCASGKGDVNTEQNSPAYVADEDYQNFLSSLSAMAKVPNGYYFFNDLRLYYFDAETKETYPVCNKPNCNHETASCMAFFNLFQYYPFMLSYYKNALYVWGWEKDGSTRHNYIYEISLDDYKRKKAAFLFDSTSSASIYFMIHRGYIYYIKSGGTDLKEQTAAVYRVKIGDTSTKREEEVIYEFSGIGAEIWGLTASGNRLFVLNSSYGDTEGNGYATSYNVIDIHTLESKELVGNGAYSLFADENYVYYGKDENTTFTKTFTPSKKHILPIYGLYPDTNNEVTIECNGKKNVFYIKTDPLPENFTLPTKVVSNKEELGNELYFVTPSSDGYVAAYDVNGDVRWYLNESFTWDIKRLNNGNILLSSNRLINPPYYMTGLMEMDLLGKVYYEYTLPGGYHHDVFELENGNFIVASDNFENGTVEDYIVEMDRKTGEIVKTIDLTKILPQDEGRNVNATDYDWFHNNSVWYDAATNSLTLSGRHQDAVVNLDYSTNEINWIVGSKEGWSKEMQKYFFEPDENTEFQWSQHAAMILPNGNLFVFDNGNNRSKTAENAVSAENNYSRGVDPFWWYFKNRRRKAKQRTCRIAKSRFYELYYNRSKR